VLIALSVTGRVEMTPAESFDQSVTDAFNAHQRRTTSAGKLLGPDAVGAAVDGFSRLGLEVLVRPSPWRLGPGRADLLAAWFTGWLSAACQQRPELRAYAPSQNALTITYATQRNSSSYIRAPPGGQVVAGSNPVSPTHEYPLMRKIGGEIRRLTSAPAAIVSRTRRDPLSPSADVPKAALAHR
jgi:hypothetical protein